MYSTIEGAGFMSDGVFLAEVCDEVVKGSNICVFNTEVVNDERELDGLGLILEEARCVFCRIVTACCEVFD